MWPKKFRRHEVVHAFTLLAALCQHVAIYVALVHRGPLMTVPGH
jgi:hypothetical protein